jgi:hypothetical protein
VISFVTLDLDLLKYKIKIVCMYVRTYVCIYVTYVCMFDFCSRTDTPICTKLGMLILRNEKEISERSKLQFIVLSSSPGEGGSGSSETKHDR